jgi:acyl carrier protein
MDQIRTSIREFLRRFIRNHDIADEEDMFVGGYVNSLFVMQLVMFVEQDLGASVSDEDLDLENFRSINAIVNFVARKNGLSLTA